MTMKRSVRFKKRTYVHVWSNDLCIACVPLKWTVVRNLAQPTDVSPATWKYCLRWRVPLFSFYRVRSDSVWHYYRSVLYLLTSVLIGFHQQFRNSVYIYTSDLSYQSKASYNMLLGCPSVLKTLGGSFYCSLSFAICAYSWRLIVRCQSTFLQRLSSVVNRSLFSATYVALCCLLHQPFESVRNV